MEARGNGPEYPAQGVNFVRSSLNYGVLESLQTHILGWWSQKQSSYDKDFHTYALEWTPDWMRFYVDSRLQAMMNLKITGKGGKDFFKRGDYPDTATNGSDVAVVISDIWEKQGGSAAAPFDQGECDLLRGPGSDCGGLTKLGLRFVLPWPSRGAAWGERRVLTDVCVVLFLQSSTLSSTSLRVGRVGGSLITSGVSRGLTARARRCATLRRRRILGLRRGRRLRTIARSGCEYSNCCVRCGGLIAVMLTLFFFLPLPQRLRQDVEAWLVLSRSVFGLRRFLPARCIYLLLILDTRYSRTRKGLDKRLERLHLHTHEHDPLRLRFLYFIFIGPHAPMLPTYLPVVCIPYHDALSPRPVPNSYVIQTPRRIISCHRHRRCHLRSALCSCSHLLYAVCLSPVLFRCTYVLMILSHHALPRPAHP